MPLSQTDDLALFERAQSDAEQFAHDEFTPTQAHGLRGQIALWRGAAEAADELLKFLQHQADKERKRADEKPDHASTSFQSLVRTLRDRANGLREEAKALPEISSGSTSEQRKKIGGYVWERLSRYVTHLSAVLLAHHVARKDRR